MPETMTTLERVLRLAPKGQLETWTAAYTKNDRPWLASKESLIGWLVNSNSRELRQAVADWISGRIINEA